MFDVMTYLDGAGSNVAVVGEAGGEGRSVVEGELGLALALLQLLLKRVDFRPVRKHALFLSREVRLVRDCKK